MTRQERKNPDILKASRKKRIAAGAGLEVQEINKLLKMHRNMADMMKAMGSGKRGPMAGIAQAMGFGGGMPSPEQIKALQEKMPGGAGGMAGICRRIFRPGFAPACRMCRGSRASAASRRCPASAASPDWGRRNETFRRGKRSSASMT